MNNPKALARSAGVLYLALALLGVWAQLVARSAIYVAGDAAATTANIVANESLYRWALAADILMATVFVFLGMALHRLLSGESPRLANTLLVFVAVGAGSILLNLVFHAASILTATNAALSVDAAAGEALTLLLVEMHQLGYVLGGIFFGLWLLPMGLFAYRSSYFGKVAGIILVAGSITWLLDPVLAFAMPDAPAIVRDLIEIPTIVAEFGLILFLLIVGVRLPKVAAESRAQTVPV